MLRVVLAVLVAVTVVLGEPMTASAQERTAATARAATPAAAGPLAPGGAAGIKQAQAQRGGIRNFIPLALVSGLAILVVVTGGDDDESTTTTTGSN